jgi:hypothetical protein
MPLTKETLKKFKKGNVFFETGSHRGDGIYEALNAGFKKIISVEIEQNFINICYNRFPNECASGIIQIIKGDTQKIMGDIINQINEPITFWLDAHWDGDGARGENLCPLYHELNFIKNHPIKDHLILIDDMRMLGGGIWGNGIYKENIIALIKEINVEYKINYTDGDLTVPELAKNDIMVAQLM